MADRLARILGSKRHPADLIAKQNVAVVEALADSNVQKRVADLGQDIPHAFNRPPNLSASSKRLKLRNSGHIRAAGIKAE